MGEPPLTSMEGIGQLINLAEKGGCLTGEQLEQVAAFLSAVKRLKDYLGRSKNWDMGLPYYEETLEPLEQIRGEIHQCIRSGRVEESASKYLRTLRNEIEQTETKMKERADAVMRTGRAWMSDSFTTIRSGHICVPVKKEYRHKIKGAVIDKSATGSTLFIEPEAAAKYCEELTMLRLEEEDEVRRILYSLSAMVAEAGEQMGENQRIMEKLDFAFAKGKLSIDLEGTEPKITQERKISLVNARHPLMDKTLAVPFHISLGDGVQGIIITGPNTGGKTVTIKTVALNCMMAQCGLHVTCEEASLCMNNAYLCDIGDGQDMKENLSTFSAHITNVLDILRKAGKESLVVLDELGSGTDPAEGMGIAVAILEELRESGSFYLVTTHYPEVKAYGEKTEGVVNARMTFDRETLNPLYQLVVGESGESCAFYIAQKLGMPGNMLKRAALAAYGENHELHHAYSGPARLERVSAGKLQKRKTLSGKNRVLEKFHRGDSVQVLPERKTGIVCQEANEKGVLQIQLPGRKIWISHKRLKLLVSADQLYPEDYDFSIVFDSVEHRKLRHQMERKHVEGAVLPHEES